MLTAVSVHVPELKLPPAPPSLHDTVPVEAVCVRLVSTTVALKVIGFPIGMLAGFGVTWVTVGSNANAVRLAEVVDAKIDITKVTATNDDILKPNPSYYLYLHIKMHL